ncbi:hypothetical protein PEBR_08263 [Penicillium brasilianum]|uniref:Uncharacterized protein n=1 Tax=Penicillium brasilianum TaxID=104259 RepID=A0A1S9RWL0_PENBI|nr:hypothetical protein PEBR_08263 [Penicillium brasilianum]
MEGTTTIESHFEFSMIAAWNLGESFEVHQAAGFFHPDCERKAWLVRESTKDGPPLTCTPKAASPFGAVVGIWEQWQWMVGVFTLDVQAQWGGILPGHQSGNHHAEPSREWLVRRLEEQGSQDLRSGAGEGYRKAMRCWGLKDQAGQHRTAPACEPELRPRPVSPRDRPGRWRMEQHGSPDHVQWVRVLHLEGVIEEPCCGCARIPCPYGTLANVRDDDYYVFELSDQTTQSRRDLVINGSRGLQDEYGLDSEDNKQSGVLQY